MKSSPLDTYENGKVFCTKHDQPLFYIYKIDQKLIYVCQMCEDENNIEIAEKRRRGT